MIRALRIEGYRAEPLAKLLEKLAPVTSVRLEKLDGATCLA